MDKVLGPSQLKIRNIFDFLDIDWSFNGCRKKKPDPLPDENAISTGDQLVLTFVEQPFAFLRDTFTNVF